MPEQDASQSSSKAATSNVLPPGLTWMGSPTVSYWNSTGSERIALLRKITGCLADHHWFFRSGRVSDNWDLDIYFGMWTILRMFSTQEDHGQGRSLIRLKYCLKTGPLARLVMGLAVLLTVLTAGTMLVWLALGISTLPVFFWWRGTAMASRFANVVDHAASEIGLTRLKSDNCPPDSEESQ